MLGTLLGLLCAMQSTVEQNDVVTAGAFTEHVVECAVASAIDPQHTAVYYPMVTSLRLWTADVWKMDAEVRSARERDNGVDILYVAYVWREPLPGECPGFRGTPRVVSAVWSGDVVPKPALPRGQGQGVE